MFALAVPGTIAKAATNNNASAETIARADRCIHPPRPRRGRWVYEITGAPRNVHADSEHSSARGEPMPGFIKMEMEDRLAIVTVNRPDALNALNSTVLRELSMAIEHPSMAADVGAIILTGVGDRAFVAGADIKEMANLSPLEMQRLSEMGRRLGDAMASCNKPIIAAINGFALGGGCELALACDIRIASVRAELGQPEVNIGIIPGFGGSQRLPRLVGPGWAAEMIYTGDRIDAATAERIGLVNRVVPADRLIAEAKAIAHAKACLRAAWDMPLSAGLDFETAAFGIVGSTHDKAEGMRAFIEKRKPAWTGA